MPKVRNPAFGRSFFYLPQCAAYCTRPAVPLGWALYRGADKPTVNKIKWAQLGTVTEPGRYEYPFAYLTISTEDLAVSKRYPSASFTLIRSAETNNEFRLGAFTLPDDSC